jgi:small subunit ribosomal protein S5
MAGGAVRTVLEVAGIKNIIAKQLGSDNLLNNARATIVALESLITQSEVDRRLNLEK